MPRCKSAVKIKNGNVPTKTLAQTMGAVDLHFHGAFGIDLMSAESKELNVLSEKLWKKGIAAFCPTTLSEQPSQLLETVQRLGSWIRSFDRSEKGAIPLGIHLEGPFIHPAACGAHPPHTIRPLSFEELERLWTASHHTLKILTFAPEFLSSHDLHRLVRWARKRKIALSLGHSRATTEQAQLAFQQGIQGVTHAWNALPFHHRAPGPLGAALSNPDVYLELILDQIHVDPILIRWTRKLHSPDRLCFVSDCTPAAGTRQKTTSFGPLQVSYQNQASRLPSGDLAGGGILLTDAYFQWLKSEAKSQKIPISALFHETIQALNKNPLAFLGIDYQSSPLLKQKQVIWKLRKSSR